MATSLGLKDEAEALVKVIGEFIHKYPIQLSGGMQRRAELARALINEPTVMIMDDLGPRRNV